MILGETFLNLVGPREHLWVVSTLQDVEGRVVIFNFTTCKPGPQCDHSCIVHPGEHPFVKHETVVFYAGGQVLPVEVARTHRDSFDLRQPVNQGLLRRIQKGALESLQTPGKLVRMVEESIKRQERDSRP